jgi:hypothetical protein
MKIYIFYLSERFEYGYSFSLLLGSEVYWYLCIVIIYVVKRTLQVYVLHQPILIFMREIGLFKLLENNFGHCFIYVCLLFVVMLIFFLSLSWFEKIFTYIKNNMFVRDNL